MEYGQSKRFLDSLADWEAGRPAGGPVEHNLPRMQHLLSCLGNPESAFRSIIVGGTNGKGTTASFLAHLLKEAGHTVGLYTSPHLHSIRERIQVDGTPIEKEHWAEGVNQLVHASFSFEDAGFGAFTKFEAITALAALQFKREGVAFGVFEVGLGGRYDATNAWDSELAVLTSVQLDHTEILGDTVEEIARDKLHITRAGHPLFTPSDHADGVRQEIVSACASRDVLLVEVDPGQIEGDGPDWLRRGQSLATAVSGHLIGEVDGLFDRSLESYKWPGRFEVGSDTPLVMLDGAHNPAAATALVDALRAKSDRWRFIVGVSQGHAARDLISALAACASEVVVTSSDHPRALDPQSLAELVPDGVPVRVLPEGIDALRAEVTSKGPHPACVTGSLHLVAKAREALGLVEEREGISEEVLLESLRCLEQASESLGLPLHAASEDGNVVRIDGPGRPVYFMRNKHPFNDYVTARLAEDKAYQYELFLNAGLRVPYTMKLFNPYADERFNRYQEQTSVADLVGAIEARITYPMVVKRNQGSFAQGVYLEHGREGLAERLELLFRHSGYLNNILICQSFVAGREYRAVASGSDVLLVYEKQGPLTAETGSDLNPLHRPGGLAVKVEDEGLLKSFTKVAECIAEALPLGFYAIDAIAGVDGLSVLEVNPNPVCYFFNACNGRSDFVSIYERLLRDNVLNVSPSKAAGMRIVED
jgi:dihydrofolate synthase / folylpolyglutamate synthase